MHVTWKSKQLIKWCIIRQKVEENKTTQDKRKKNKIYIWFNKNKMFDMQRKLQINH